MKILLLLLSALILQGCGSSKHYAKRPFESNYTVCSSLVECDDVGFVHIFKIETDDSVILSTIKPGRVYFSSMTASAVWSSVNPDVISISFSHGTHNMTNVVIYSDRNKWAFDLDSNHLVDLPIFYINKMMSAEEVLIIAEGALASSTGKFNATYEPDASLKELLSAILHEIKTEFDDGRTGNDGDAQMPATIQG